MLRQGQILKELLRLKGVTQEQFGNSFDKALTRQGISKWFEVDWIPAKRLDQIEKLLNVNFSDYKFCESREDVAKVFYDIQSLAQEQTPNYKANKPGVPFYDVDVAASNVELFNDKHELPTLTISIPGFEDCDFGVPIFGSSMYPTYENGCIVMCKKINDHEVIQYGEPHLIVTKEQRFVKRILKSKNKEFVICASDNGEAVKDGQRRYDNFELAKSKIRHLFIIKGAIKRSQL